MVQRDIVPARLGYVVMDKYVNLAGASYEFTVDRLGRSLTLKPLAEKLPDRASLEPGSAAPEFSFTDLDGKPHRLYDYRGKVVLLDFGEYGAVPASPKPEVGRDL